MALPLLYTKTGQALSYTPNSGTFYSADGKTMYTVDNGKLAAATPMSAAPVPAPTVTNTNAGSGYSGGGSAPTTLDDWQYTTNQQLADRLGITNYKYEDILKSLNNATAAKFNEYDTQIKQQQSTNLRSLEDNYVAYLQALRENKANAVQNGIIKGQAAANYLTTMLSNNSTIAQGQQSMQDILNTANTERATALATNADTARTEASAWDQYLGNLRGTYTANNVNKYAAELTADAQTRAAGIAANATTSAANSGNDFIYSLYKNLYGANADKKYLSDFVNYNQGAVVANATASK